MKTERPFKLVWFLPQLPAVRKYLEQIRPTTSLWVTRRAKVRRSSPELRGNVPEYYKERKGLASPPFKQAAADWAKRVGGVLAAASDLGNRSQLRSTGRRA